VIVVDLATGRRHRISGEATGLAWSPGGTLAVVTHVAPTAAGRIRLIPHPFRARRVTAGSQLPCPTRFACDAQSPSFDSRGDVFYLAEISPRAGNYCFYGVCFGWTYAIVSGTRVLASVVRHEAVATYGTVDASGTAMIFTLPDYNGYPRVWEWRSGARPSPIRPPGAFSAQPAW
jgi:hypothetical protein